MLAELLVVQPASQKARPVVCSRSSTGNEAGIGVPSPWRLVYSAKRAPEWSWEIDNKASMLCICHCYNDDAGSRPVSQHFGRFMFWPRDVYREASEIKI